MDRVADFFKLRGDKVIWVVIFLLSLASILVVYSSTGNLAYRVRAGNTSYFVLKQIFLLFGCYLIIFWLQRINYKMYSKYANVGLFIAITTLILAKVLGTSINDTSRWIRIPFIGFNFQPSEFAKLALIVHVARTLSKYQDLKNCLDIAFWKSMIPIILVCGIIFFEDFSTSVLLGLVCFMLMFIGRIRAKYLYGTVGVGLGLVIILIALAPMLPSIGRLQTVRHRIERFVGFEKSDSSLNYQVEQAKIAIASGGAIGKGPGNSTQRDFLPHPYSDFIYAIILEEYGWAGGICILILYLFVMYRAGAIVRKCTRTFPAFLVFGLSLSILFQALTNMAVSLNLIPVTGQPLPMVSMGGTSLIFTSAAFGIIISVSREFQQEENEGNAEA